MARQAGVMEASDHADPDVPGRSRRRDPAARRGAGRPAEARVSRPRRKTRLCVDGPGPGLRRRLRIAAEGPSPRARPPGRVGARRRAGDPVGEPAGRRSGRGPDANDVRARLGHLHGPGRVGASGTSESVANPGGRRRERGLPFEETDPLDSRESRARNSAHGRADISRRPPRDVRGRGRRPHARRRERGSRAHASRGDVRRRAARGGRAAISRREGQRAGGRARRARRLAAHVRRRAVGRDDVPVLFEERKKPLLGPKRLLVPDRLAAVFGGSRQRRRADGSGGHATHCRSSTSCKAARRNSGSSVSRRRFGTTAEGGSESADAVAGAGFRTGAAPRRRGVVLLLGSDAADSSRLPAAGVRRYLEEIRVPFEAWNLASNDRPDWPGAQRVTTPGDLYDALLALRRRIACQSIAWVEADFRTASSAARAPDPALLRLPGRRDTVAPAETPSGGVTRHTLEKVRSAPTH